MLCHILTSTSKLGWLSIQCAKGKNTNKKLMEEGRWRVPFGTDEFQLSCIYHALGNTPLVE